MPLLLVFYWLMFNCSFPSPILLDMHHLFCPSLDILGNWHTTPILGIILSILKQTFLLKCSFVRVCRTRDLNFNVPHCTLRGESKVFTLMNCDVSNVI